VTTYRETLWVALSTVLGMDAGDWLQERRAQGASWRELEADCTELGIPVSHEYLRSQAKLRNLDRSAA